MPLASRGTLELGLGRASPWLASCADWPVCARSRVKVKPDGSVRPAEEEYSPESGAEALAARRLADGCGASGSCTGWARLAVARPKQIRATIKRKHTII